MLIPALSLWSWKVLSISVSLHSLHTRTYPNPQCILLSACGGLSVCIQMLFCFNPLILNKHDGSNGKGRERETLYTTQCWPGSAIQHKAGGGHCWPWWCRVGISFRAAQNYIETYYLQLKPHRSLLFIHAPTHQPVANTVRHHVKDLARSRISPITFCKTYELALCGQKRWAHPTVHVNKKRARVRDWKRNKGNDKEKNTVLRKEKGRGKVKR